MNNVIFSDIECYMKGTDEKIGSNTYKISEHVPIAIGYSWHSKDEVLSKDEVYNRSGNLLRTGNRRSYFGPDCIKDYVRDLLEIETKHSIKINKAMIFTEEDKMYHDANTVYYNMLIQYIMMLIQYIIIQYILIKLEITVIKQVDIEVQHVIIVT